jgi:hypothetical protein
VGTLQTLTVARNPISPALAVQFIETLPNAQLRWIEECGHVPHLEKPEETADTITAFLESEFPQPSLIVANDKTIFVFGGLAGAGAVVAAASNFL